MIFAPVMSKDIKMSRLKMKQAKFTAIKINLGN